jgi:hypothetical protein
MGSSRDARLAPHRLAQHTGRPGGPVAPPAMLDEAGLLNLQCVRKRIAIGRFRSPLVAWFPICGENMQRIWVSTSKRGAGSSIGPRILLAAVVVVAGVIGISGIYPQVIDAEWAQDSGTHLPIMPSLATSATTKPSATAMALPLRIHQVGTTGQATAAIPPRPTPELSQLRASVAAAAPVPESAAPPALAEVPDAQAKAEAPATETAPAMAVKQTKVAKRKVAQHQRRGSAGAFAQYGGWGWFGFGGSRRF